MSVFDLACLFVGLCCEHSVRWPLASSHSTKLNAKESPDYTHYPGKLLQLLLQNSLQLPSNEIDWLLGDFMNNLVSDPRQYDEWSQSLPTIVQTIRKASQEQVSIRLTLADFVSLALTADGGRYDARSRAVYYRIASLLGVSNEECCRMELQASRVLITEILCQGGDGQSATAVDKAPPHASSTTTIESVEAIQRRADKDRRNNWLKVGLAAVGGGVAIGLTGGLAAPLIGAGLAGVFSAIGIGGTAVFLGSAGGVALLTTLFGATGMGLSSFKMAYRVRGVREFQFISHADEVSMAEFCVETTNNSSSSSSSNSSMTAHKIEGGLTRRFKRLFSRQQQADSNVNDPVAIEVEDEISADGDLDGTSVEGEDAESDYFSPPPTPIAENLIEKPADQLVTTKIPPPYVIISITGWMTKRQQSISIWQHIDTHLNQPDLPLLGDHYSLCWETRALIDLGKALEMLVLTETASYAAAEVLKKTLLAGLMSAMVIPASLMAVMSVMDNPFSVAYSRARKAGQVLADVLLHRRQGNRPVTLIGTSLGAKVIYECLLHLSEMQRKDHGKHDCGKYRGIVENIYLLGAPISPTDKELRVIHSLVSGRIVNGYCKNDWVLGFLLRAMGRPWGIAGMAPITIDQTPSPSRIENIDLTDLVSGHSGYMDPNVMHRVLDRCFVNTT